MRLSELPLLPTAVPAEAGAPMLSSQRSGLTPPPPPASPPTTTAAEFELFEDAVESFSPRRALRLGLGGMAGGTL